MDRGSWGGARSAWGWRGGERGAAAPAAASRLERVLRRLEELAGPPVAEAAAAGEAAAHAARIRCALNPPALPDAIAEAELRLGTALPADYVQFLLRCDGATLFADAGSANEPGLAAELLGTEALVRHAEEMECLYRAGCIPELVIFAAIGADGGRLAFETGRMNPFGGCGVLDARHDYRPDQWWVISRDFTSWLEELLADRCAFGSFGRRWDRVLPDPQPELPLHDPDGPPRRVP